MDDVSIAQHPFIVATVLDPQLKRMTDVPEDIRQAAYSFVRNMTATAAKELHDIQVAAAAEASAAQTDHDDDAAQKPAKRLKLDPRMAALQFLCDDSDDNSNSVAPEVHNDFDTYLSAGIDHSDVNMMDWWSDNKRHYPATALVARRILSIPATSVQSERLFSATGRLISKLRSRLLPDTAEMLVFLNKNNGQY